MLSSFNKSTAHSNFLSNSINQFQIASNFTHPKNTQQFVAFSRHYHQSHFERNFSSMSDIRIKAENGDPQAMFDYGVYLIDQQKNTTLGLTYLKKSANQGNIRACTRYVTILYDDIKESKDSKIKIDFIPYLKKAASTGDPLFIRMHADICLQLPSFFQYGLSSLSVCANDEYKDSAEYYGMLKFLSDNFQMKSCIKYLKKGTSPRTKALIDLFENGSEKAITDLQRMADTEDDIISDVLSIFAELLTTGKTDRIDKVYQKLTKSDTQIEEPWKTVLLNAVGSICIGVGELEESYRFFQKAYENGSTEQIYFLSFLRFYKFKDDRVKRRETFELIKKAYSIQIDSEEYNIGQKYAFMLLTGDGCDVNTEKAAKILLSKDDRNTTDNFLLGVALIRSNDFQKGIEILHQAALDQDVDSQKFYAFYVLSKEKGNEEARNFLKLAAEKNDQEALKILNKLEKGELLTEKDVSLPDLRNRKEIRDV